MDLDQMEGRAETRNNNASSSEEDEEDDLEHPQVRKRNSRNRQTSLDEPRRGVRNLAKIQSIFTENVDTITSIKQDVKKIEDTLEVYYKDIKKKYDSTTKREIEIYGENWLVSPERPAYHRVNAERKNGILRDHQSDGLPQNGSHLQKNDVLYLIPNHDENGTTLQKGKVQSARVEVGDISPRMSYWASIEQTYVCDDQLRLTHMQNFGKEINEKKFYSLLNQQFPDGIHGCSDNSSYINDWLLYQLFMKVLPGFEDQPDAFYYALYCLWPNKLSQRQLSFAFPKWCDLYAEDGFNPCNLEHWKKHELKAAENFQKLSCYACHNYTCIEHGFKAEIPIQLPESNYVVVNLEISNDSGTTNSHLHCSSNCWKSLNKKQLNWRIFIDQAEPRGNKLEICLDKLRILKMSHEEGGTIVSAFLFNQDIPFCDFAQLAINSYDGESRDFKTCAGIYKLILQVAQKVSKRQHNLGLRSQKLSRQARVNNFRYDQKVQARARAKAHSEELQRKALEEGRPVEQLIAEEKISNAKKNRGIVNISHVTPIVPCRHSGLCSTTEEYCACRENGMCSYLCECDINCTQRFPGCNCSAGQCQSKACQCYFANWECNPITCHNCNCDNMDEEGLLCKNFSMARSVQKRMTVAPSKIAGNGLFILEPAEKDEFITEYVGERISEDEVERRGAIYDRLHCSYIFNLPTGGAIDSFSVGNISRFANHDKNNPTLYAKTMVVAGEHRIGFYAKRQLSPGDELLFDYSYSMEHQKAISSQGDKKKSRGGKQVKSSEDPSTSSQ